MGKEGVDTERRRLLVAATTVVGGVGAAFVAVPFLASWQPNAAARAGGAPVEVDIGKLEPGQMITVEWRGKPVWILRRTSEELASLPGLAPDLRDPDSNESDQPPYCKNIHRSIKEAVLVAVGLCTHLGCSPTFRPEVGGDLGADWHGGFFCPCHGSRFDLAGRVYRGVPAPLNLTIPPHRYLSDTRVLIGDDGGVA
jgi:ubiquinol-cytochrome c reductase iron-sulfur subunit